MEIVRKRTTHVQSRKWHRKADDLVSYEFDEKSVRMMLGIRENGRITDIAFKSGKIAVTLESER